jgi:hypothetical protein
LTPTPTAEPVRPPTVAEFDGFRVESNSANQPSHEELRARLGASDTSTETTPPAQVAAAEATAATTPDQERTEQPRDEQGRFTKTAAEEAAAAAPAPKKNRAERRLEQFDATIGQKRRELGDIDRALEARKAELASLSQQIEAKTGEKHVTPATAAIAKDELGPRPSWDDFEAEGKTWKDYQDADGEWLLKKAEANVLAKLEAKQKEDREAEAKNTEAQKEAEAKAAYAKKFDDVRAKHPDFDAVIQAAADADLLVHDYMEVVIRQSPVGAELLRTISLAEHYDTTDAVSDFLNTLGEKESFPLVDALIESADPARFYLALADPAVQPQVKEALRKGGRAALLALGRIEAGLTRAEDGSRVVPKPVSQAKPPTRPVAGSRSTGDRRSAADLDFGPDYIRQANEEERAARGRR